MKKIDLYAFGARPERCFEEGGVLRGFRAILNGRAWLTHRVQRLHWAIGEVPGGNLCLLGALPSGRWALIGATGPGQRFAVESPEDAFAGPYPVVVEADDVMAA